jgi:hypothetical protein
VFSVPILPMNVPTVAVGLLESAASVGLTATPSGLDPQVFGLWQNSQPELAWHGVTELNCKAGG